VELQLFHWDPHKVPGHWIWFGPSGLSFQCHNILAPNFKCSVDVLNCYWIVLDLVAPNYPFKILPGWIIELEYRDLVTFASMICLFVNPALFLETVLTKVNSLSLGSK
jgi:hypothetical protein